MDKYEEFGNAIILQAVKDYRVALVALKKNPKNIAAARDRADCERFFSGKWFAELTSIDGSLLMEKLKREVI